LWSFWSSSLTPHVLELHAQFLYGAKHGLLYPSFGGARFVGDLFELPLLEVPQHEADPFDFGQMHERRRKRGIEVVINRVLVRRICALANLVLEGLETARALFPYQLQR